MNTNDINDINDLIEFDKETERLEAEVKLHLSKFQNIDELFLKARGVVEEYFQRQNEYKDFYTFESYLKKEVLFYVQSFELTRHERKKMRDRLDFIEETYDKLIYFGEFNPVEALRERLRAQEEKELHPETKGVVDWVKKSLGKIIK